MEPKGSWPCPQQFATSTYPQPVECSPPPPLHMSQTPDVCPCLCLCLCLCMSLVWAAQRFSVLSCMKTRSLPMLYGIGSQVDVSTMNWKRFRNKQSRTNPCTITECSGTDWGKPLRTSVRMSATPAEIACRLKCLVFVVIFVALPEWRFYGNQFQN
jgi:hypothetical protein